VTCRSVRRRFSGYRDRDLAPRETRAVEAHLEGCPACAHVLHSMGKALDLLSTLPRAEGSIVGDVLSRLEVESRGPGLELLFRPLFSKRPLILPSLLPAALLVMSLFFGALALDHGTRSTITAAPVLSGLTVPTILQRGPEEGGVLTRMGEGTLFFETEVGPDGNVSKIRVVDGDSPSAGAVLEALRQDRFEPVFLRGRPVAVSVYRLVSRMDVWPKTT
jgi:hypothetical protein